MKPELRMKTWLHDDGMKKVMLFTALFKLVALITIGVGAVFFPFQTENYLFNFHFPPQATPDFWTHFKTWDAQHYLYLAKFGYTPHLLSNSFYPLFPFLIHVVSPILGNHMLATGLLLSNVWTFISMGYLYVLVRNQYDAEMAWKTCLLLLAFPMSFFLGLVYADSLFLMLAIALFYYLGEHRYFLVFLCACLLPLSRPTGILLMVPAIIGLYEMSKNVHRHLIRNAGIVLLGFGFGFLTYMLILKIETGTPWAGFDAQAYYVAGNSIEHLWHPLDWISRNFLISSFSWNGPTNGLISRLCFMGFLVVAWSARKILSGSLWVYTLVLGLVSALSGNLTSYPRYLVMVFPIFIFLAVKIKDKIPYYMVICVPLQIIFLIFYSMNGWVA